MEKKKHSGKKTAYSILAIFLAALFFLSTYATLHANIRFSRLKYVEETAKYAAEITGENTEYLSESRLERAWKILRSTIKQPETYEDYDLYASIAIAREDFEGAAAYLQGCIDTCEGTTEDLAVLHLRLGSLHILREDPDSAMAELNKAQELNAYLAPVYYLRAQLYTEQGEAEKALEDFRTYCMMDGSDPEIKASLAPVFEETGDLTSAVACYTAGIGNGGQTDPHLYVDRARCEVQLENLGDAIQDLERYFALTQEDPDGEAAALLGACRMETGKYGEAAELFHKAIENDYADQRLLYEQSLMCLYQTEQYEQAAADGEKAIAEAEKTGGADTDLYFWTGMSYMAQGLYEEAGEYLISAEKKDPDLENIHYYLGVSMMAQEDPETAAEYFTTAVSKKESTAASLYNRAVCYIQLEKYEEAAADLEQAAEDTEDKELAQEAADLLKELKEAMHLAASAAP